MDKQNRYARLNGLNALIYDSDYESNQTDSDFDKNEDALENSKKQDKLSAQAFCKINFEGLDISKENED